MTKKLEETFNISGTEIPDQEPDREKIEQDKIVLNDANDIIDRIDAALPQVGDLDNADYELDELSDLAKEKFEDLMNLGMNVEARYSGTILQTAGVLLGHAISAKQAKIDKKLRMVDLQLKKMRLDQTTNKENPNIALEGHATLIDRNDLLNKILNVNKAEKDKK